jgi:hypothetical protein
MRIFSFENSIAPSNKGVLFLSLKLVFSKEFPFSSELLPKRAAILSRLKELARGLTEGRYFSVNV